MIDRYENSKTAINSKTMVVNALAPVLSLGLNAIGLDVSAESQISILCIVNMILRAFTGKSISSVF